MGPQGPRQPSHPGRDGHDTNLQRRQGRFLGEVRDEWGQGEQERPGGLGMEKV